MMELVLLIISAAVSYFILYLVVKAAVKNAILETRETRQPKYDRDEQDGDVRPKIKCSSCGEEYPRIYPHCPFCGHQ